jgi:zinc transporter 9
MVKIDNIQDAETFMLKHGENIVDRVGAEIDRIERNLRVYKNLLKKFLNN